MIRAVRAINPSGQSILMQLNGLEQGPFSLWSIEGLDPGEADINVTEIATVDGAVFNMARQTSRELTLTVLLNWYDNGHYSSIQSAREEVYKYFPLKKQVRIVFYLDDVLQGTGHQIAYATDAYVKSVTVDIFAKTCAAKITVLRTNPLFFEYEIPLASSISGVTGFTSISVSDINKLYSKIGFNKTLFEFKYSNGYMRWVINGEDQAVSYDISSNYGISATVNIEALPNKAYITVMQATGSYGTYKFNNINFSISPAGVGDEAQIALNGTDDIGCNIIIPFKVNFSTFKNYYITSTDVALKDASLFKIMFRLLNEQIVGEYDVWGEKSDLTLYPNKMSLYAGSFSEGHREQYILPGDILVISTEKGEKNVTITRAGVSVSMLGLLDVQNIASNNWIRLKPGNNYLQAKYEVNPDGNSFPGVQSYPLIDKGIVYSGSDTTPPNTFHVQYPNARRGL